jgi:Putative 2OG-Fe(II) oxygenase
MSDATDAWHYFTSPIYKFDKPEFLKTAAKVCAEHLKEIKKTTELNDIYPLYNTGPLHGDDRLRGLVDYVLETSWNILNDQGYNMDLYRMEMYDFWCQEHHYRSGHERHFHNSVISGFYFIDTPPDGCRLIIHEPRSTKEFVSLIERDPSQATYASNMINFTPEAGSIMFLNSCLPHSFTRNLSKKPFRMIHFNVGVSYVPPITLQPSATVI